MLLLVWKRHLARLAILLVSLSAFGLTYLLTREPETNCPSVAQAAAKTGSLQTYPRKVVVKPWQGQHQVYGIFVIPGGHTTDQVLITLPTANHYCGGGAVSTGAVEGIQPESGHYVVKAYLNTRIALWLMLRGWGDQLNNPYNWTAIYTRIK